MWALQVGGSFDWFSADDARTSSPPSYCKHHGGALNGQHDPPHLELEVLHACSTVFEFPKSVWPASASGGIPLRQRSFSAITSTAVATFRRLVVLLSSLVTTTGYRYWEDNMEGYPGGRKLSRQFSKNMNPSESIAVRVASSWFSGCLPLEVRVVGAQERLVYPLAAPHSSFDSSDDGYGTSVTIIAISSLRDILNLVWSVTAM
ncbi:hypothetical protein BC827DRAFT_1154039 [Russula dissimulans]|nr:hypothetical protein BC827DRAFT_1154039 [Russula dissimulans]